TTAINLTSGVRELKYTELPCTVKDAISVTRGMGFKCLWVDSICILQGSNAEAQADWLAESSCMRDYYKDCTICIATDNASSDAEGFLNTKRLAETRISISTNLSHILGTRFPTYIRSLGHGLRWTSLLINYTKRSLTFQTDRLIAISGLAQGIQAQSGYTYWAGIWAEDVYLELSWKMRGLGQTPETYIAPSWSWAALEFCAETDLYYLYHL
ncbi:uncharacterized protein K444DRAFT_535357, partial [Hyaloscypha bicolor E]